MKKLTSARTFSAANFSLRLSRGLLTFSLQPLGFHRRLSPSLVSAFSAVKFRISSSPQLAVAPVSNRPNRQAPG
jgi:hypothetical protein